MKNNKQIKHKIKVDYQKLFNTISIGFICACVLFYGARFTSLYIKNKKVEDNKDNKKENLFSAIFAEDTMVEDPEDVIKTDTNPERKELFKKTYAALLSMFSYDTDKKKKKKTKTNERDIQNVSIRM